MKSTQDLKQETNTEYYTGFYDLDELTHGLHAGELIVIGARPSMGKTAFALNIVENVAMLDKDKAVLIFSVEMPSDALAMRMIVSLARVERSKAWNDTLNEDERERIDSAVVQISEVKILIDDTPDLTLSHIMTAVANCKENISMIVIDYLQLLNLNDLPGTRCDQLTEALRFLKVIARQYNVPVVILSQLNRELEKRPNKRPVLSDMRDAGSIEEVADLVLFVYRDEVYYEDTKAKGIAEIIVAKQRNGETGTIMLKFDGKYFRFSNFAPEFYDNKR